jgi:hypothetical protein
MIIAVDFDGTIVEHKYPEIGKVMLFAFETLKQLQKQGHELILWTSRHGKELNEAIEFCARHGVEFYAVNSHFPGEEFVEGESSRKIVADVYIDDRIPGGFQGWSKIWELINSDSNALIEKEAVNKLQKVSLSDKLSGLFRKK